MIKHYEIKEKLHTSSLSEVYRAVDSQNGNEVAVKKILHQKSGDRSWFYKEAEIARKFRDSPFFVHLVEFFEEDNSFYLITEYIHGKPILQYQRDWKSLLDFFIQTARALQESHQKGILHGDIKPENILIDEEKRVKLLDFGGAVEKLSGNRINSGTLPYMSPEHLGYIEYPIGNYTDLYSLGICFYRLLSGRFPFHHKDRNRLVNQILTENPVPLSNINPDVPFMLSRVIERLIQKDPGMRYQISGGLIYDLERISKNPSGEFELAQKDSSGDLNLNVKPVGFENYREKLKRFFLYQKNILVVGENLSGKSTLLNSIPVFFPERNWILAELKKEDGEEWGGALKKIISKSSLLLERQDVFPLIRGKDGRYLNSFLPPDFRISEEKKETLNKNEIEEYVKKFLNSFLHFLKIREFFILIDNVDCADSFSLSLLRESEEGNLIVSSHSGFQRNFFLPENRYVVFELTALSLENLEELLQEVFGAKIAQEDLDFLLEQWKNHSFYPGDIIQNLKLMLSDKIIFYEPVAGKWEVDRQAVRELDFKSFFGDYIAQKFQILEEDKKNLLILASLLPFSFDASDISGISEAEKEETNQGRILSIREDLESFYRQGLVRKEKDARFSVVQEVKETILKKLSQDDKKQFQARIMKVLQRNPGEYQKEITDLMIEVESPRAKEQIRKFIEKLKKENNYPMVVPYYLKLGEYIRQERGEEFLEYLKEYLNLRFFIKDLKPMESLIQRGEEILKGNPDISVLQRISALLVFSLFYFTASRFEKALEHVQSMLPLATEKEENKAAYFAYTILAAVHFFKGEFQKVEVAVQRAFGNKTGDSIWEREAYNYSILALSQVFMGKKEEGLKNAVRGIQLALQSPDLASLAVCFHFGGYAHSFYGEVEKGMEFAQESLQIGKKLNNPLLEYSGHFSVALAYIMQDILEEGEEHLRKSLSVAEKIQSFLGQDWIHQLMLELYFRKKDRRNFEKFFESFQQLQSIFGNTPLYRVVFNKGKGILSLFYHDFASAENNLKKALKHSLSSENPYPLEEARINGLLYLLYQELGDYNTSSSYYKKAEDFFNTYHLETDKKYYLTRQWDLSATDGSVSRGSTSRGSVKENMAYENILKSTAIITSIRDPKKILIKLTDILFQTFGAEKIHFCLDMEGKRYTLTSDKNLKTIEPEFVAKNLAEKAVKEGNFIIFQNLQKSHPEFEPEKSVLIFPIIRKGTPSGYLYLSNPILPGVFSGEDIKILTALMNQGLIAIENAIHFINEQNARARAEATMKAFRLFVPTQFLDIVASEGIDKIRLGNAIRKKVSILFSDIRDFTSISEKMSAEELMIFLNSYMDVIVGKNVENGKGFIDKFIGDAVMAVFDQSSSDRAMETAVNIQKSLVEYNHILKSQGMVPVSMGVGLNMGEVIMGTVGTQSRMDSTLIGDEVNLASRLESLTKLYGIGIIVSASTIKNLEKPDNFYFREIDSVTVKGKSIPVTIYEVFDWEPEEVREMKKTYESELLMGISFYKIREFGEAKNYFEMCQARNRQDPVVNVYLQRCEKYMVNPPDEDWNGAIQLDKK